MGYRGFDGGTIKLIAWQVAMLLIRMPMSIMFVSEVFG